MATPLSICKLQPREYVRSRAFCLLKNRFPPPTSSSSLSPLWPILTPRRSRPSPLPLLYLLLSTLSTNRLIPSQRANPPAWKQSKRSSLCLRADNKMIFKPESFYNSELDVPNAVRPFCRVQEQVLPSSILGTRTGKVTCNALPLSTLPLQHSLHRCKRVEVPLTPPFPPPLYNISNITSYTEATLVYADLSVYTAGHGGRGERETDDSSGTE